MTNLSVLFLHIYFSFKSLFFTLRFVSVLVTFVFFSRPICAQSKITKKYDIEVSGLKIGTIEAEKHILADGKTQFKIVSNVSVNLVVYQVKFNYSVNSVFEGDELLKSEVKVKSNKGDFYTVTEKKNNAYWVEGLTENGKINKIIREKITTNTSKMYFEKPDPLTKIFADYYGELDQLKIEKDGSFTAKIGKNNDFYYYQNGKLTKVIKKNPIKNVNIKWVS